MQGTLAWKLVVQQLPATMKIAGPMKGRGLEPQRGRPNLRPVMGLVVGLALYAGVLQFTSSSGADELLLMSGGR